MMKEWQMLYEMAKKQSLVGICFAGMQKLQKQQQCPPEILYLQWMGMEAKIQQRNEVMNRQCLELQQSLEADGFRTSVMKGQGVANLYNPDLRLLRQSGDIDIWVEGGIDRVYSYITKKYGDVQYDYINAHVPVFEGTEVEIHWRVTQMTNLFRNAQFQRWVAENKISLISGNVSLSNGGNIKTPTLEFNAFYLILHIYNHAFSEGVGMRQLMDYYFTLKARGVVAQDANESLCNLFNKFGLLKFARDVMWIMKNVFGLQDSLLPCTPNEEGGTFLLSEVMECGNMGHHDTRIKDIAVDTRWNSILRNLQHNIILIFHYPKDAVWTPVWMLYNFIWKRLIKS